MLAQTGPWIVLAISPTLWLTAAAVVVFAATMPIFGLAVLSYQMEHTPDELRGRVVTAFGLMTWGATPLGAAAAGELLDRVSIATTVLVVAGWTAAVALTSGAVLTRTRHHLDSSRVAEGRQRRICLLDAPSELGRRICQRRGTGRRTSRQGCVRLGAVADADVESP